MAVETLQEKNKRLTKEVKELKQSIQELTEIMMKKDKLIADMRGQAEGDFLTSPTYQQMCAQIKRLEAELALSKMRDETLEKRCQELSERLSGQEVKQHIHNERGAGRKKLLDEGEIAKFREMVLQDHDRKQIMQAMGISQATYYRYKRNISQK